MGCPSPNARVKRTLSDAKASRFGVCTWLYFLPSPIMSARNVSKQIHTMFIVLCPFHLLKDHFGGFHRILRLNNRSSDDNIIRAALNRRRWCGNPPLITTLRPLRTDTRRDDYKIVATRLSVSTRFLTVTPRHHAILLPALTVRDRRPVSSVPVLSRNFAESLFRQYSSEPLHRAELALGSRSQQLHPPRFSVLPASFQTHRRRAC